MSNTLFQTVVGSLAVLFGAVWALQGAGVLPGSFMSGSRFWLVVGIAVIVGGLWLIRRGFRGG
ncbi:MAG: hypothetical protein DWI59_05105 [Chloroflexi bacterium]|nr:MAG: hypothetical protein DWI59_05105 [Chloroflexota bacterium]